MVYWKKNPEEVATPQNKKKMKPTPRVSVEEIEDFDQGVVRRAIYGMYDRNEHVTLDALLDVIRANTGPDTASIFEGRTTTLYKLLHKIGFSWQKSGRKVLMEDVNVDAKKIAFLREYRKLAVENNNFVFLDETWIFSTRKPAVSCQSVYCYRWRNYPQRVEEKTNMQHGSRSTTSSTRLMKWYVSADTRFCGCLRTIVNIIQLSWCGQTARGTKRNIPEETTSLMMQLSESFGKKPLLESQLKMFQFSWSKNVDHTEKIINDDWAREIKMDASETQPFIIQIGNNESDEEEEVLVVPLFLVEVGLNPSGNQVRCRRETGGWSGPKPTSLEHGLASCLPAGWAGSCQNRHNLPKVRVTDQSLACCASLFSRPLYLSSALAQATTPILSTAWTAPQSMSSEPSKCIQRQRELLSLLARVMVTVSHPHGISFSRGLAIQPGCATCLKEILNRLMLRRSNLVLTLSLPTVTLHPIATNVAGTSFCSTATTLPGHSHRYFSYPYPHVSGHNFAVIATSATVALQRSARPIMVKAATIIEYMGRTNQDFSPGTNFSANNTPALISQDKKCMARAQDRTIPTERPPPIGIGMIMLTFVDRGCHLIISKVKQYNQNKGIFFVVSTQRRLPMHQNHRKQVKRLFQVKSSAAFTPLALQTGKYSSCRLAAILFVLETLAKERAAGQFDSIGDSQRKLSKPLYLQLWNQCLYGPHLNATLLIQSGTQSAGAECVSSHSSYVPGAGSTVRYYVSKPRNKRTTKDREKWAQDHELRTSDQYSNPYLPNIGSPVFHESDALDRAATEAGARSANFDVSLRHHLASPTPSSLRGNTWLVTLYNLYNFYPDI
uniref:(California timema) hypothetical protein n=1 Tax=Timema californicum TaxID=61474 RepID=A0A7R9J128_TIMCA|nr:unnamed protein product [Timema californicum]